MKIDIIKNTSKDAEFASKMLSLSRIMGNQGFAVTTDNAAAMVVFQHNGLIHSTLIKIDSIKRKVRHARVINKTFSTDEITSIAHKVMDNEGDSYDRVHIIKTKLRGDELNDHLNYEFESYCQHEYDCCGHWYSRVWTHKTRQLIGDLHFVVIHHYQNV
jgi:hypothetical protein